MTTKRTNRSVLLPCAFQGAAVGAGSLFVAFFLYGDPVATTWMVALEAVVGVVALLWSGLLVLARFMPDDDGEDAP